MKKLITYYLILLSLVLNAQEKDKFLPKGNDFFQDKSYPEAEANYRISQSKFTKKAKSYYNLGTVIYKQNQSAESKYQFAKAIKYAKLKSEKYQAFHNLGNSLMKEMEYAGAVEAYKNALRNNPNDEQTRYNFALAKKMLKDNPPKKEDDKKKDKEKDKKDDKKDNKEKDKEKDKKDDKKEGDNKDKQDKGEEPKPKQPSGASKQRIENMLDAVNNEEKKIQEKVNQQKVKSNPNKPEKDW